VEVNPVPPRRPSAGTDAEEVLPCGTPVDELLGQVAEGRPPRDAAHQQHCPHCRAALAELAELWAPVHELVAEDVRAPGELLEVVMARVRELSRNPWHAIVAGSAGHTRIAARVVGAVARLAAESVPHVALAHGRGRDAPPSDELAHRVHTAAPGGDAGTDVGVAGTHVVVDVQITVDYGASIPEAARQIREQISRDLHHHTGLTTTEVNVRVVDLRAPAPPAGDSER
jgi:uncharacterized alkaline shock family protein YloU